MKKANVLCLREMGCNDNNISTDIKNHRIRVVDNIDIFYNGEKWFSVFCKDIDSLISELEMFSKHIV